MDLKMFRQTVWDLVCDTRIPLSEPYDHNLVKPCVESKVFGIGVESYTVGSAEFTLSFAALHDGCMPLMDNGHYHPLEYVSDKIRQCSAFIRNLHCISQEVALGFRSCADS